MVPRRRRARPAAATVQLAGHRLLRGLARAQGAPRHHRASTPAGSPGTCAATGPWAAPSAPRARVRARRGRGVGARHHRTRSRPIGVSMAEPYVGGSGPLRIVAYDFGVKQTMLRAWASWRPSRWCPPALRPPMRWRSSPTGSSFPTGPVIPSALGADAATIGELLGRVPVFGICLGHQLLADGASGRAPTSSPSAITAATIRCARLDTGQVEITSQNHNYAVDATTLPTSGPLAAEVTHVNLNDGVVEGIRARRWPPSACSTTPKPVPGRTTPGTCSRRFRQSHGPTLAGGRRLMPQRTDIETHPRHRLGPHRDRPGVRVRLLGHPGVSGARRRGLPGRARELEPGHDHDRSRRRRPDLRRAARPRRARADRRTRTA